MGFLDKARAFANEAADVGKRIVGEVTEKVDEAGQRDDWAGRLVATAKDVASTGRDALKEKREEVASTATGKSAGVAVRKFSSVISGLPIVSAAVDVARTKNCVDLLLARLQQAPDDPYCNLWLAESLIKTSEEIATYQQVKGLVDPSSLLVTGALKQAARLGHDGLPTDEKLLRRAWVLSSRAVKTSPRNSSGLDVLARVYLAKGDGTRSIATAKAAVMANYADPIPRVTLSRALLAIDRVEDARKVALSAVEHGSSVGYLIAARAEQLQARNDGTTTLKERVSEYEQMVDKVTVECRVAYSGAYRDAAEVAAMTKQLQAKKAEDTWSTVKRWGGIIRDA